jgi:AAA+ superfamily predicted ATPase
MILTTNRIETMDLAFDSRVDIRLHYPKLDIPARRKVWSNFVTKLPGGSSIGSDELDKLAELELNGRQIKSTMKTSHLLSSEKDESLGIEHVRTVLKITRNEVVWFGGNEASKEADRVSEREWMKLVMIEQGNAWLSPPERP